MEIKLNDSELKVMKVLWDKGEISAKGIVEALKEQSNYSRTTTYTLIKRCIEKNAVERREPGFICKPLVTREQVQEEETLELINKLYDGVPDRLVASILGSSKLKPKDLDQLRKIINEWEDE